MNKFTLMGHWKGEDFTYELQIQTEDKVEMIPFKSLEPVQKITTLQQAKTSECKCNKIGDIPGVSRLFGEFGEPIERELAWMDFEGVTKDKQVYMPLEKGEVEIIKTENGSELFFNSKKLTGRWLMRTLPNILSQDKIKGEKMNLLWKPDTKETQMTSKLENMKQIPLSHLKGDKKKINSSIQTEMQEISISSNGREFEAIIAAEGTWIDKFGQKFTYTKEFINTLFTSMNMQVLEGTIPIGVDKEHSKMDNGRMTKFELLDKPIAYIKGRGFFNGTLSDVSGVSIDAELDAVFLPEFQSWFPVNGVTKRVSLVASPACKVCHFTPKR